MEYLFILIIFLLSGLYLEKKYKIHLYSSRKQRLVTVFVFFAIGVIWDHYAIYRGHWVFPMRNLIGIKIGLMPLEEYIFMLVVPFWIVTVYKLIDKKLNKNWLAKVFDKK